MSLVDAAKAVPWLSERDSEGEGGALSFLERFDLSCEERDKRCG